MPHVASTQEAAEGHHRNKVACHSWETCAIAGHQPELRKYCNGSNKKATHPEGVKEGPLIEIAMEQGTKDQAAQCKGGCWKRVIICFIRLGLHIEHTMQKPEHHS